jgi:hypothetical protein
MAGEDPLEAVALRARQFPDYPLAPVLAVWSTSCLHPSGGLTQRYAPFQFIPFDPFLPGGVYW